MVDYFDDQHDEHRPASPSLDPAVAVERVEERVWNEFEAANPPPTSLILAALEEYPAPPVITRFVYNGNAVFALSAPSDIVPVVNVVSTESRLSATSIASSNWRSFTDEEESRLLKAWASLNDTMRTDQAEAEAKSNGELEGEREGEDSEVANEDILDAPHIVPVGLDSLFSVNLKTFLLSPDFWTGSPAIVLRSQWFYAPPSSSSSSSSINKASHLRKIYPVDPALEASLEGAYLTIRPFMPSYAEELASAVSLGPEAEAKLRHRLLKDEEEVEGANHNNIEVIFQDHEVGRLCSTGIAGSFGIGAIGRGQVVLRGWDALSRWSRARLSTDPSVGDNSTSTSTPAPTPAAPSQDPPTLSTSIPETATSGSETPSFLTALRSKIGVPQKPANTTQEAMTQDRAMMDDESEIRDVDELVLVVHGVGQKLAGTFESFNFVHAVNTLRTTCTTLSTSPTLSPLLHSKRAQFIPVRWRAELVFDDDEVEQEQGGEEGEMLGNRFSLEDAKIAAVPLLRTFIDGMLDVPYYQNSRHKAKMLRAVVKEANKIFRLFSARNPNFSGTVSIIAHSLGSTLVNDLLSTQPTFVKPLNEMSMSEKKTEDSFIFDTRCLFLVGSPLAFFLHLYQGQLIARSRRIRSTDVGRDIALDRERYGCLAVDSIYNIYYETDPVAFTLNSAVDVHYAKLIKPIAILSTNVGLLKNLQSTYERLTSLFDVSSLFASPASTPSTPSGKESRSTKTPIERLQDFAKEKMEQAKSSKRPGGGLKRMPTERPGISKEEFTRLDRAEKRFKALNAAGGIDFYLPSGMNQYLEALSSHGSYWYDKNFAEFILLQLFSQQDELAKIGREEIGVEMDD